ncbi:hypothetical protein AURDEDRAFT_115352 [Auricularia subglabra TFB-10046 SS5]|nr:hypothetical protein AURDEDRAFT_115352 [Auricularia subglabra TFB-10046 SS5]
MGDAQDAKRRRRVAKEFGKYVVHNWLTEKHQDAKARHPTEYLALRDRPGLQNELV